MTKKLITAIALLALCVSVASADQFINRATGESFYGYPTNRTRKEKTKIYVQQDDKFENKTVNLAEYAITYGAQGRRNNVIVIPIAHPDMIVSGTVSKALANTIKQAANKGPRYIILEIDNPGGRGEYMKEICTAIDETVNCPVIAFISGGRVGGAYSVAAAMAMTCNALIMSPDAQIGTLAPDSALTAKNPDQDENSENTYASNNLASYAPFAASLAEKNGRPGVLAAAMLDTSINVIEVSVDDAGTRKFIDKDDKEPSDSIIRSWSKLIGQQPKSSSAGRAKQLTMTAKDALDAGIVQKIVSSRSELIKMLGASDAKLTVTRRIDKEIKKFAQNKRIVAGLFLNIEGLSARQNELSIAMEELASEIRYGNTPEQRRLRRIEQEYLERELMRNNNRRQNRPVDMRDRRASQSNDIDPYAIRKNMLLSELSLVLEALSGKYRQAIVLARKHPGVLPLSTDLRTVERSYDEIQARRNSGRLW